MAERRKLTSNPESNMPENDRQYLERTGASAQIRDALAKIIENRPLEPVAFLADYFESFDSGADVTTKAFRQITLTHHSKPAFDTNLRIAYDILSTKKVIKNLTRSPGYPECLGAPVQSDFFAKNLKGINGAVYLELLDMVCKGFPTPIIERLLSKIGCRNHEAVVFDIFKTGLFTCFVLKDYLAQAESLFKSLDIHDTGKANKILCDAVLQQLFLAVNGTNDEINSVLEVGYSLSPDKIYGALTKAMAGSSRNSTTTISCDQFLVQAADSFLTKVNRVR
ncbi:tubulin polyglutamylase complex subunit 1-like isoform X1 [Lineus longissimus]|uniref:tubulin polyglutamylase complex subunit 1-like isoform X1 n=1 Tax=Lineus longissimus TaxID=88925 RepID=UPI002B4DB980